MVIPASRRVGRQKVGTRPPCSRSIPSKNSIVRQSVSQRHRRLPAERLPRPRDVRLPLARIIGRQWTEHHLRGGAGEFQHQFGQLPHGELGGVAKIDRARHVVGGVHEAHEAIDQVAHIAE
jgi:hypothetical protein